MWMLFTDEGKDCVSKLNPFYPGAHKVQVVRLTLVYVTVSLTRFLYVSVGTGNCHLKGDG